MNLNVKSLMLVLGTGIVFSLSGCGGGSSTPTDTEPGPGEVGYQVISEDGLTVTYLDANLNERNATVTTAAAEYHTGVNFGNTLFDSADKKCQNCHNELYDTWKSSMHGQSWADPIFQSKFQDFLRTHLAKIGEQPDGGILYQQKDIIDGDGVGTTKNMFSGAAQTCIKCHAPGAYYAGDVRVTVTDLGDASNISSSALSTLKTANEVSDPHGETAVIAANPQTNRIYKATFQIGHEANREGINCAFCHSIETPRLMKEYGMDNGIYTLAQDMRVGPHGPIKANAGTDLNYHDDATNGNMNKFFRLWGPEKYTDYNATPKGVNYLADAGEFDEGKAVDGRYTMTSKDLNGTNGKVHFTGGPFYGPYGVTGTTNENETDQTDRLAQVNPHYDVELNNHFGESGKGLCLSCHQRSAGAAVPGGEDGAGHFMELCSTQMAVTTGDDTASNDTLSSPKCQKCHMERIEGTVLHQWARPDKLWTLADNPNLTAHFDPTDPEGYGDENPVAAGWLNSHAFLGASKTGQKASVTDKIKSGFEATVDPSFDGNTLTVTTALTNKTAHMFPGAHPMRRVFTRLIVTDGQGNKLTPTSATGISTFTDIENNVQPLAGKVLHSSALTPVPVNNNGSENLDFPGKVADLNGSEVGSQKFDGTTYTIRAVDSTADFLTQTITNGVTEGNVTNAAIVSSADTSLFTRIYGHETGKRYDSTGKPSKNNNDTFIVRPGFDSWMVEIDNRLSPNETETYTLTYDIEGKTDVKVEYRVYYMQKGANGKFPATADGWLNEQVNIDKKLLITEVYRYPELP
ncbi:MAG TPA: multiheme c-type cytochrome [Sulfurovum sp.]